MAHRLHLMPFGINKTASTSDHGIFDKLIFLNQIRTENI